MRRSRSGFTLVETIVALAVAGTVLFAGRMLVESAVQGSMHVVSAAQVHADAVLSFALLQETVHAVDLGAGEGHFQGSAATCQFRTTCLTSGGWSEPCLAAIRVTVDSAGTNVALTTNRGIRATAYRGQLSAKLLYLESAANGGIWRDTWIGTRTAPLAIGIALPGDTVILRIGRRG